ncbi:hypothetical protein D3C83_03930 [compost metagenome]
MERLPSAFFACALAMRSSSSAFFSAALSIFCATLAALSGTAPLGNGLTTARRSFNAGFALGATCRSLASGLAGLAFGLEACRFAAGRALAWVFPRAAAFALDLDFVDFAISLFPPEVAASKKRLRIIPLFDPAYTRKLPPNCLSHKQFPSQPDRTGNMKYVGTQG